LAIASGGGHWIQLSRVVSAFAGCDTAFVTTLSGYREQVRPARFYVVRDANLRRKVSLLIMAVHLLAIVVRERPDVIISTGAAPGYFGIRIGKLFGARTIWLDSMANSEQLSVSGRKIKRHADLWLTQWPHLAQPDGPYYKGGVL
jgi:hypothetical protein